jgi:hypothetical protein
MSDSNTDSIKTVYYFSSLILARDSHSSLHSNNCIAVHPSSIITVAIYQRVNNTAASAWGFCGCINHVNVEWTSGTGCYGMTVSMPKHSKFIPSPQLLYNVKPRSELAGNGQFYVIWDPEFRPPIFCCNDASQSAPTVPIPVAVGWGSSMEIEGDEPPMKRTKSNVTRTAMMAKAQSKRKSMWKAVKSPS